MEFSLFFIADRSIYEVRHNNGSWELMEKEHPYEFHCIAIDPKKAGRMYIGTFDDGLMVSDDYGKTLKPVGEGITHPRVLSVAVSEDEGGQSIVWAGTEPSELFYSKDNGKTWQDSPELPKLPSHTTWSFPPRPYTHHVRYIQPDIHDPKQIFVGIELGGVMRSLDQAKTWEDRKPNSQYDCHTLTMNAQAKGRIYEAAGGGFAESTDGGNTWATKNEGLGDYTYLVDVETDPQNPDVIITSAAKSARTAYMPSRAHTVIARREGDGDWEIIEEGLPHPDGASIFSLTTRDEELGTFYAVNNLGLYRSTDSGKSWQNIQLDWPERLKEKRIRALIST